MRKIIAGWSILRIIAGWSILSSLVGVSATIAVGDLISGLYLGSVTFVGGLCWFSGVMYGSYGTKPTNNVRIVEEERPKRRVKEEEVQSAFIGEVEIEQREDPQ